MDTFSTKSLALEAQKKVLGKLASKGLATALLDQASSEVLDELYRATKEFTHSRKDAQRLLKDLVKVALKLALLLRAGQLGAAELETLRVFQARARRLAMTAVSFQQVAFTFDRRVLASGVQECAELLHQAAGPHLSAKSHGRIQRVCGRLADGDFLCALYSPAEPYLGHLRRLCDGLTRMLDEGSL
ncbi:tumor necrosis factor alpha-induced protein 8-like protein 1 [Suncus etruscus]|uniref:tumor necrosis factor alpha-induced protein 8-like protein 1 n=1 Tax=Suncus etruscus TaxID=109475 RepID=UPI002110A4E2|nr:tumor necrosis factor alpha-induced protein 8-like protein 1 [Suncus etruscus]